MTQHRPITASQHSSQEVPLACQAWMADRVYPTVDPVQPPGSRPLVNGAAAESKPLQLGTSYDPMLPRGKAGELPIKGVLDAFASHG